MKKRWLALLLSAVLMVSLAACDSTAGTGGSGASQSTASGTAAGDASIPEGMTKVEESGLSFAVPEGYEKQSDNPIIYLKKDSDETDNINLTVGDKDVAFGVMTESMYKNLLDKMFEGMTVEVTQFERTEVAGSEAIQARYKINTGSATLEQVQVLINADQLYTVTYTMANGTLGDFVQSSIDSIRVIG